ncbi:MAG TPA: hypothetical protein GXX19_08935 [Syntrophomonadaceae bacterium]|nr:hypothetical protein [Syntrophomonadaceae bacterium]
MIQKATISVNSFRGINSLSTRAEGEFSGGANFVVRGGVLSTRRGTVAVGGTPFSGLIGTIYITTGGQYGHLTERLVVVDDHKLWRQLVALEDPSSEFGEWKLLHNDLPGNTPYSGVVYQGNLVIGAGPELGMYDVGTDGFSTLKEALEGELPWLDGLAVHKDVLFGWGVHGAYPHRLYFNGYEEYSETVDTPKRILKRDLHSWPPDFAIDVPTPATATGIYDCLSMGDYLLILTKEGFYMLYGDNEDDFRLVPGAPVGVMEMRCSGNVLGCAMWLTVAGDGTKRIIAFSGSEPREVSMPVFDLLNELPRKYYLYPHCYAFGPEFWVVLPGYKLGNTHVFIYNIIADMWQHFEFPYEIYAVCPVLEAPGLSSTEEPTYLFGSRDGKLFRMKADADTDDGVPITTWFKIGPLRYEGRKMKPKRLYVVAKPKRQFSMDVYVGLGRPGVEVGPYQVGFTPPVGPALETTQTVKLWGIEKDRDVYLKFEATDRVDDLRALSVVVGVEE